MGEKKFTDEELLAALNLHGNNKRAVAVELGVSRAAVRKRMKNLPSGALVLKSQWNETTKVESMKDLQRKIITSVTARQIMKSPLNQRVNMMKTLEEMIRLNEGKATEHIAHGHYQQLGEGDRDMIKRLIAERTQAKLDEIDYEVD